MTKILQLLSLAAASLILNACGGGSDASSALYPPEPATATLSINTLGAGTVISSPAGIACGTVCAEVVEVGTSVTLSAVPAAGYQFVGWSGGAVDCAGTSDCTMTVAADSSVTATFSQQGASQYALNLSISGSGSVTSDIGGLNCSADCGGTFVSGTLVTLTARPANGYTFTRWSGNGISCSGTTCRVPMTSARSVTATFNAVPPVTYQLDVAISPSAKGSVGSLPVGIVCGSTCSAKFFAGAVVTLAATPEAGYQFNGWTGAGCSGTGTCIITMSAARSVTAVFAVVPINTYALNVAVSGSGTVSSAPAGLNCPTACSATFTQGTSVILTAVPAAGYRFAGWSGAGCPTGTGTCPVTMTAATTVGATFTQITYLLSVTKQGTGVGTVTSAPAGITCGTTCSASYNTRASVVLTAAPASGSTFGGWSGACAGTATTCTVAMSAVKAVSATFNLGPTYVLTVATSGSGTVGSSPTGISCGSTCGAAIGSGAVVTLTQAAGSGYTFSGWTGACSGTGVCSVSMTAAKTVGATFTVTTTSVPAPVPAPTAPGLAACVPSGLGTDVVVTVKVAPTALAAVMDTEQPPVPLHAPVQPPKA